jgi:mono/diheme cytochrome c family protein
VTRALAIGLLLFAGCAGQIPPPTEADALRASARFPGTTVADLAHGRTLYIQHCSGCHALFRPQDKPPEVWPKILKEMTPRSRLTEAKIAEISRYLIVASTAPRS